MPNIVKMKKIIIENNTDLKNSDALSVCQTSLNFFEIMEVKETRIRFNTESYYTKIILDKNIIYIGLTKCKD